MLFTFFLPQNHYKVYFIGRDIFLYLSFFLNHKRIYTQRILPFFSFFPLLNRYIYISNLYCILWIHTYVHTERKGRKKETMDFFLNDPFVVFLFFLYIDSSLLFALYFFEDMYEHWKYVSISSTQYRTNEGTNILSCWEKERERRNSSLHKILVLWVIIMLNGSFNKMLKVITI